MLVGMNAYRRNAGEVAWSERTSFIVGPDVDLPLEAKEDIVRFFMEVESDGLIKCTARSYNCEGIVCLLACH